MKTGFMPPMVVKMIPEEVRRRAQSAIRACTQPAVWPSPAYDPDCQPHFLFILTLPFSGSTALSQLLNTSHRATLLQERGEGQWLIPGLRNGNPWDPRNQVDYESVKAVWLARYQLIKSCTGLTDVVIEKSPPNIARYNELRKLFRNHSAIANNRNPYAYCASLSRLNPKSIEASALSWAYRSAMLKDVINEHNLAFIFYERFCLDPVSVLPLLPLADSVKNTISWNASIKVKDYPMQPLVNQNQRQINQLSADQIQAITLVLRKHKDLMDFFG